MTNILKLQRDVRPSADIRPSAAGITLVETERKINRDEILSQEVSLRPESRIPFHTDPHGCAADRYRLLRMRLRELWIAGKLKTLLITSPLPEDGKSTTAMNVATALAEGGKYSVLLIEADLYHSPLAELLGIRLVPVSRSASKAPSASPRRFAACSRWAGLCCRRERRTEIQRNCCIPKHLRR